MDQVALFERMLHKISNECIAADVERAIKAVSNCKQNAKKKESRKPAKKRKRNHSQEDYEYESSSNKIDENLTKNGKKSGEPDIDVSDDELKIYLEKALAGINPEKTTMKTVYGMISTEYPNFDISSKKEFIKDVVKSLMQT